MSNTLVSIPLCALKRSKANIRKTNPAADIEQLAASIASKGLLENLIVRPTQKGGETYEVIAGSRRLQALKLLAKQKRLAADAPVSCLVLETTEASDLTEISLAENEVRAPIHPADQYDAFANLQKQGLTVDDIAARFGITTNAVRQRLKLASVSPKLMAEYRKGAVNLEQLMAFTITDDHAAQEEVWHQAHGDRSAHAIRRLLTRAHVEGSDRRARYIGAKAYEEAGGAIIRDLFAQEDDAGYFSDSRLLDQLVLATLNAEAETLRKEGWAWVEVRHEDAYLDLSRYDRVRKIEVPLSETEAARLEALGVRYDELAAGVGDDEDSDAARELDGIASELEGLQAKREAWPEDAKATSGAIVSLDYTGRPQIVRGLVKPEDRARAKRSEPDEKGNGSEKSAPADAFSDALILDLSAHRTAALQEALAADPVVALDALLKALVLGVLYGQSADNGVAITTRTLELDRLSPTVAGSKAGVALATRAVRWQVSVPDPTELWTWIRDRSCREKLELLAYCTARTLDATARRNGSTEQASGLDEIATALGLDMADWWRPTKEGYFEHITKAQIVDAVTKACSEDAARGLQGLKKPAMAAAAEALVTPTRWLPDALKAHEPSGSAGQEASPESA